MNVQAITGVARARTWVGRVSSLFVISALELATPFLRMLILARFLELREIGFASVLAATYAMFALTTDIAVYRFVFNTPKADFEEALASAHALALLRGVVVGGIAVALAPFIAAMMSLSGYWPAFASLGCIIFIASFENLAPRIAERHYQYGAQFKMNLFASALSFAALVGTVYLRHDHTALLASLAFQTFGIVVASRAVASVRYRLNFRSPYFKKAFHFSYPLMANGVGLAISGQGDRFLVGGLLGLQALAIYSIALLVTVVPITMVFRVMGTVNLAAYHNAALASERAVSRRIRFASRLSPLVATLYSLGILTLMNVVTPLVFGAKFVLTGTPLCLLALGAFFRIVRGEPFSSLLLHERRTKQLAAGNLSVVTGLAFAALLMQSEPTVNAALAGRLLGEVVALVVTFYLARSSLSGNALHFCLSVAFGFVLLGLGCGAVSRSLIGFGVLPGVAALALSSLVVLPWGLLLLLGQNDDLKLVGRLSGWRPFASRRP